AGGAILAGNSRQQLFGQVCRQTLVPHLIPEFRLVRIGGMPGCEPALPGGMTLFQFFYPHLAGVTHVLRHLEWRGIPPEVGTGSSDLVLTERRAVRAGRILTLGAAVGDVGGGDNDRRLAGFCLGGGNGGNDLVVVVAVNFLYVPAAGGEAPFNILGPGQIGFSLDGDAVAVVDVDQVAQLEVTGQGRRLVADSFLETAITKQCVYMMVDRLEIGSVETLGGHF